MVNWKRIVGVAVGFAVWTVIDALTGKPNNAEMALLAGFVVAWSCEKQSK